MLLDMLVLLDSILQMQLFQINQSEDSSKKTIMSVTTCHQLHQCPITSASNYNRITLAYFKCKCKCGLVDIEGSIRLIMKGRVVLT